MIPLKWFLCRNIIFFFRSTISPIYMISGKYISIQYHGRKQFLKLTCEFPLGIKRNCNDKQKSFHFAEKPIFTAFSKHHDHFSTSYRTLINVGITTIIISFTTTTNNIFHWDPQFLSRYIDLPFHNTTIVRNRRRMTFKTSFITSKYLL